jgi:drug/metabolite transporter (DMT)-like permease
MPDDLTDKPVFAIKKLGGLLLLIFGVVVALLAYSNGSTGLSVLGILMAAIGVVLMALKIVRRNQGSQF